MRTFINQSTLSEGNLALAIAPALTPTGIETNPSFFRGHAVYPQLFARGLLVLADITATRYFNYVPEAERDPILSAQGDRLRAECFSACNGVYARLDLLQSGFDGDIGFGTTNVDIGFKLRGALTQVKQNDKLHVNVGSDGLTTSHIEHDSNVSIIKDVIHERPVQMPDRWVRALGNAAEIHYKMQPIFSLNKRQAQLFVASLPPATGKNQEGWLTPSPSGTKLSPRRSSNAVYISGLHRLSALKRIMTNITDMVFYMPKDGEQGASMLQVGLPGARITLSLTAKAWHGYSGEGALLPSLADQRVLEDADDISSTLKFDAVLDEIEMARQWDVSRSRVQAALSLLAVSGKLGYDAHDNSYFHRELPDDVNRIKKDNPRLVAAQKLVDTVKPIGVNQWLVHSNQADYRVTYYSSQNTYHSSQNSQQAKCTCTWYLNHQNKRGPCKHILAVQLYVS